MAKSKKKTEFRAAKQRVSLTVGDAVRIARELQGMSQTDLAVATDIAQPTISGIESNRVVLGVQRAVKLARALGVHPAVLLFPQWDVDAESGRKTA